MIYDCDKTTDNTKTEGEKKGPSEKYAAGLERGRMEVKITVARKMLEVGLPFDQIVTISGLPEEQVRAISKQLEKQAAFL